jgi:hypothetical protein
VSVLRIVRTGDDQYSAEALGTTLGLDGLADLIRLGHEIEVMDKGSHPITKDTLVDVALHSSGVAMSASARSKLLKEDEFTLHQLIEDGEVATRLQNS